MKKTIIASLMSLALALSSSTAFAAADIIKLNLSNEYSATSIHGVGDTRFANLVKQKTGGSVEVIVHFGASLGFKSADHFDAVGEGSLEIADTYAGSLGGINPLFLVSSLPFLATTVDEARVLYEVAEPYLKKIFKENGQILLYASPWPPSGLWGKKPFDNTAALKMVRRL